MMPSMKAQLNANIGDPPVNRPDIEKTVPRLLWEKVHYFESFIHLYKIKCGVDFLYLELLFLSLFFFALNAGRY